MEQDLASSAERGQAGSTGEQERRRLHTCEALQLPPAGWMGALLSALQSVASWKEHKGARKGDVVCRVLLLTPPVSVDSAACERAAHRASGRSNWLVSSSLQCCLRR